MLASEDLQVFQEWLGQRLHRARETFLKTVVVVFIRISGEFAKNLISVCCIKTWRLETVGVQVYGMTASIRSDLFCVDEQVTPISPTSQ